MSNQFLLRRRGSWRKSRKTKMKTAGENFCDLHGHRHEDLGFIPTSPFVNAVDLQLPVKFDVYSISVERKQAKRRVTWTRCVSNRTINSFKRNPRYATHKALCRTIFTSQGEWCKCQCGRRSLSAVCSSLHPFTSLPGEPNKQTTNTIFA